MRLIDANLFAKKVLNTEAYPVAYVHGHGLTISGLTISRIAELLDEIPTVDAIPIEWIQNILAEIGDDSPYRPAIKWLLLTYKMERKEE